MNYFLSWKSRVNSRHAIENATDGFERQSKTEMPCNFKVTSYKHVHEIQKKLPVIGYFFSVSFTVLAQFHSVVNSWREKNEKILKLFGTIKIMEKLTEFWKLIAKSRSFAIELIMSFESKLKLTLQKIKRRRN